MIQKLNPPLLAGYPCSLTCQKGGVNKACRYFPCHKVLEDCTFCYCPFYPCLNISLGKYVYSKKAGKDIWSCQDCSWIHKRKVTERIYNLIRQNKNSVRKDVLMTEPWAGRLKAQEAGIIVLGHGSRVRRANNLIPKVIRTIKKRLGLNIIEPAYLQLCRPNLSQCIKGLISRGAKKIVIIPFFLFVGNHVRRDIPEIIKRQKANYPQVKFIYANNLGEDSKIVEIVIDRIFEAGLK